MRQAKGMQRLQFSYLTDELGHIIETREVSSGGDGSTLKPFSRPNFPPSVDTEEKKAMWFKYWDDHASWWASEQQHERRRQW